MLTFQVLNWGFKVFLLSLHCLNSSSLILRIFLFLSFYIFSTCFEINLKRNYILRSNQVLKVHYDFSKLNFIFIHQLISPCKKCLTQNHFLTFKFSPSSLLQSTLSILNLRFLTYTFYLAEVKVTTSMAK